MTDKSYYGLGVDFFLIENVKPKDSGKLSKKYSGKFKLKPILTTTKSLSIMPLEITRQTRFEKDLDNLAVFRANMALKELDKKR